MEKTYIVYKHTSKTTGKSYIGVTSYKNPNSRWEGGSGYFKQPKFYNDIQKYGWDDFTHEILETNIPVTKIDRIEQYYIKLYNSCLDGYNTSPGGNLLSPEGKQKISQALTGIKRSQETIDKQIKTKLERSGWKSGIDPIDTALVKKVRCKETNDVFGSITEAENWSNSCKIGECCAGLRQHAGRHPETNELLSWEYADNNEPITIRCIEKRITRKIKKVMCIETGKIYENATEAEKDTGYCRCNILRVCQGKRKTVNNTHWKYIED